MRNNSKPFKIFVSYSHKDQDYRNKLHEALAPLRRRMLIADEWYDGKLVPGGQIDANIFKNLSDSDIIILLLSSSYINSDYCWDKEMAAANILETTFENDCPKDTRVVGIVIRAFHLEGLEISQHKLLPKDRKPIQSWKPQDTGWLNVCEGIEQVINDMLNPSPVDDALNVPKAVVATASQGITPNNKYSTDTYELESITEFWKNRNSIVVPGCKVKLHGTFSQFAPMLIGAPKAKARLHKIFREELERNSGLIKVKQTALDACLSVSAGQMVWRLRDIQSEFIYFGLYNSIVRNSIPVLVARDYYESKLSSVFQHYKRKTFEARITGRVIKLNNLPTKQFLEKHAGFISESIVDDLCKDVYGLLIDGNDTVVEPEGTARYLDGDIWVALESEGKERFLTSFLDISNRDERKEELEQIFQRVQKLPGPPRIIAQYDEEREFTPTPSFSNGKNQFLDSIWSF